MHILNFVKRADLLLNALTAKGKFKKVGGRKLSEVTDKFIALIVVIISHMYTSLQTHEIIYIKYLQLLYINYTSLKWFEIKVEEKNDKKSKVFQKNCIEEMEERKSPSK